MTMAAGRMTQRGVALVVGAVSVLGIAAVAAYTLQPQWRQALVAMGD